MCEADELAHEEMGPGKQAYREIVAHFGPTFAGEDGRLDRRRLGRRVFGCPEELARLNAILHPRVIDGWRRWLDKRENDSSMAAVIVPLLYEAEQGAGWDAVICLVAPRADQMRRLKERGLSEEESLARLRVQMSQRGKMDLADYVVVNTGAEEALREQLKRVMQSIVER